MQVTINLKAELLTQIDEAKGTQSRSGYIVACVSTILSGGDTDKRALIEQVETLKDTLRRAENENEFLKQQYSKINDALSQRLITEGAPKRSWWSRLRGRE